MTRQELETRFSTTIDAIERIDKTIAMHEAAAPKEHALIIEGWKKMRKKVSDNFINDFNAFKLDLELTAKTMQQNIAQAA